MEQISRLKIKSIEDDFLRWNRGFFDIQTLIFTGYRCYHSYARRRFRSEEEEMHLTIGIREVYFLYKTS